MNNIPVEPFPGSQYNEISPILLAVFNDIQARHIDITQFSPAMTKLPPDDPGEAYVLNINDRWAHVVFKRFSPGNGDIELEFGTGGRQFGPARLQGVMVVPSQYTGLISLMVTTWICLELDRLNLLPFSWQRSRRSSRTSWITPTTRTYSERSAITSSIWRLTASPVPPTKSALRPTTMTNKEV
jgi:hypothetical protein